MHAHEAIEANRAYIRDQADQLRADLGLAPAWPETSEFHVHHRALLAERLAALIVVRPWPQYTVGQSC